MKKEMKKKLIWAGVIGGISAVVAGVIGYFAGQPDDENETTNAPKAEPYHSNEKEHFDLPHGTIVDYWTEDYGDSVIMTNLTLKDIPETLDAFAQHENRDGDTQVNIILDLLNWRPEDND